MEYRKDDIQNKNETNIISEFKYAFGIPAYVILHLGFLTCGFHACFLAAHLPGEIDCFGYNSSIIAICFSILGACNIIGNVFAGILGKYIKPKNMLGSIYLIRVISVLVYLILPKTIVTIICFSIIAGLTFESTVPPLGNIEANIIKPKYLSALLGLIFLTHQIGAFLGAWVGGLIMELTGSFLYIWIIDISLSLFASIISYKINTIGNKNGRPASVQGAS